MSPLRSCVLLLLLACVAGQITDVVVVEPYDSSSSGAPAPALIATVDAQGNVQQRIISPQDVEAVRVAPRACGGLAVRFVDAVLVFDARCHLKC